MCFIAPQKKKFFAAAAAIFEFRSRFIELFSLSLFASVCLCRLIGMEASGSWIGLKG
jgi:hypothetical protein